MTILPMNQLLRVRETLISINLAYHSLISLPEEFFHLRALKVINLKANCLLALPPSIAKLTSLQELDVSWNLLEALPVQLAELAGSLKTLKLHSGDAITGSAASVFALLLKNLTEILKNICSRLNKL